MGRGKASREAIKAVGANTMALREVKGKGFSDGFGEAETGRTRIPSEPNAMDFHFVSSTNLRLAIRLSSWRLR